MTTVLPTEVDGMASGKTKTIEYQTGGFHSLHFHVRWRDGYFPLLSFHLAGDWGGIC